MHCPFWKKSTTVEKLADECSIPIKMRCVDQEMAASEVLLELVADEVILVLVVN